MSKATDAQKAHLNQVNQDLMPLFFKYHDIKIKLQTVTDPIIKDSLEYDGTQFRNQIIEKMLTELSDYIDSLIYSWNNHFDYSEGKSYAHENLLEAVQRYNPHVTPFCKFTSFFYMYNQNIFKNLLIGTRAKKRDVFKTDSLDATWESSSDDIDTPKIAESNLKDTPSEDPSSQLETKLVVQELYKKASPKQKRILKRLYFGHSRADIARSLKMSQTRINSLINQLPALLEK